MNYIQYPVHPSLRKWIRYYWSYDANPEEVVRLRIHSFADLYPRLIFQDIRTNAPILDAEGNMMPICYLSGLDTRPSESSWDSRFSHFGVSFMPFALHRFFGMDAAGFTNQMPDITLLHKTEIPYLLLEATNHHERIRILNSYFYQRLEATKGDTLIAQLFQSENKLCFYDERSLRGLASKFGISERQMQRRFKMSIGVSSRKFGRIRKFEKALYQLSEANYGDLTQLAYTLDYADQPHFINDFKLFSGHSPYAFLRKSNLGAESASFIYPDHKDF